MNFDYMGFELDKEYFEPKGNKLIETKEPKEMKYFKGGIVNAYPNSRLAKFHKQSRKVHMSIL